MGSSGAAERVSVIIPHRDALDDLDRCLCSLEAQDFPADRYEIIVADNGSTCGPEAVVDRVAGRARVVSIPTPGAGPARNGGVEAATGELLAFIDSDCVADPGWLSAGVAALASCDVAGGAMRVLVDGDRPRNAAEAFELVFAFDNRDYVERMGFSVTANLFVRRVDFRRVGGFRTGVSEDQEWCWRARAAGLRLAYAPEALVGHPARADWGALIAKWRRIAAEQYWLSRELRFGHLRWLARSWALPLSVPIHAIRVLRCPALDGAAARGLALAGLVRLRFWRFFEQHRLMLAGLLKSPVDNRLH